MDGTQFGTTADGEAVHKFVISGGGLRASVMSWGAVLQDLRLEDHDAPLVLGFEKFEDYPAHSPYMGAIAGRCANRIRQGRFTIDGRRYQADVAKMLPVTYVVVVALALLFVTSIYLDIAHPVSVR